MDAATAQLMNARTISLTGDVTGSTSFDGSGNVSISSTIASNSVALGTDTTGNYVGTITAGTGLTSQVQLLVKVLTYNLSVDDATDK